MGNPSFSWLQFWLPYITHGAQGWSNCLPKQQNSWRKHLKTPLITICSPQQPPNPWWSPWSGAISQRAPGHSGNHASNLSLWNVMMFAHYLTRCAALHFLSLYLRDVLSYWLNIWYFIFSNIFGQQLLGVMTSMAFVVALPCWNKYFWCKNISNVTD